MKKLMATMSFCLFVLSLGLAPLSHAHAQGLSDMLWWNQTNGAVYYWQMSDLNVTNGGWLVGPDQNSTDWQIVGTPDLNGDGQPDILWQNRANGGVYYWLMDGMNVTAGDWLIQPNSLSTDWQILCTPDLNGDGWADIIWQSQSTGGIYVWLMQGTTPTEGGWLVNPGELSSDWKIVGSGDYTGSGSTDLMWQNLSNGGVYVWLMDGVNPTNGGWLINPGQISTDWHIVGTPDLNGDGHPDILWQNVSDGGVYVFLMDGFNITSSGWLVNPGQISPDWQIVGLH